MTDIILILSFLAIVVFGYFLLGRHDQFLKENRKAIAKEQKAAQKQTKPYIITEKRYWQ